VLNGFGSKSLVKIAKMNTAGEDVKIVQKSDPVLFSKITKPFSDFFLKMLPK